jgi:hypothetical protein
MAPFGFEGIHANAKLTGPSGANDIF